MNNRESELYAKIGVNGRGHGRFNLKPTVVYPTLQRSGQDVNPIRAAFNPSTSSRAGGSRNTPSFQIEFSR